MGNELNKLCGCTERPDTSNKSVFDHKDNNESMPFESFQMIRDPVV